MLFRSTRTVGPFGAGLVRLPLRIWLPLDVVGALVANVVWVGGGYVLGSAFLTAEGTLDQSPVVRVGLIVVGLAWFLVMRRVLHDRMAQRVKTEAAPEAAVLDAERVPRERDPLE